MGKFKQEKENKEEGRNLLFSFSTFPQTLALSIMDRRHQHHRTVLVEMEPFILKLVPALGCLTHCLLWQLASLGCLIGVMSSSMWPEWSPSSSSSPAPTLCTFFSLPSFPLSKLVTFLSLKSHIQVSSRASLDFIPSFSLPLSLSILVPCYLQDISLSTVLPIVFLIPTSFTTFLMPCLGLLFSCQIIMSCPCSKICHYLQQNAYIQQNAWYAMSGPLNSDSSHSFGLISHSFLTFALFNS